MKWLELKDIKQQLRIEPDFELEDDLLKRYGSTAENSILELCNRTYDELMEDYGAIPDGIYTASMLLTKHLYEHRGPTESVNLSTVPYNFDYYVKPYMRLTDINQGDTATQQVFIIGSDVKILVEAELPDDLTLTDVDFTVKVYNNNLVDKSKTYDKSECIETMDGDYVVLVDSEQLGIGRYLCKLTVEIPDTDYPSGFRKEVVKINPHVTVKG